VSLYLFLSEPPKKRAKIEEADKTEDIDEPDEGFLVGFKKYRS